MKMTLLQIFLTIVLLHSSFLFGSESVPIVTVRKWYAETAETQKETAALDRLYRAFVEDVSQTLGMQYVPVDSIQRSIGRPFLFDWRQYGDAMPLTITRRFGLQAVVYFTLEKTSAGYSGRITAYEFPSYTLINEFNHISLHPSDFERERRRMQGFITDLIALRTPFGFPVSPAQRALVLLIKPKSDDFLLAPATVRRHSLLITPRSVPRLAVPVVPRPSDQPAVCLADSLFALLGVDAVVSLNEPDNRFQLIFPGDPLRPNALTNRLPLWPGLPNFTLFSVPSDTAVLRLLGSVLLQPQTEIELPEPLMQPFLLKRIQLLEADTTSPNSIRRNTIIDLYRRLLPYYDSEAEEYDWLNANLAAHLLKVGNEREAAGLFRSSCRSFSQRQNRIGELLTALQAASLEQRFEEYEAAEDHLLIALTAAQEMNDAEAAAFVQYRLGELLFAVNRRMEAWERFRSSIDGYTAVGNLLMTARIYIQLGILMRQSNSVLKAREYLEKGLEAAERIGAEREVAYAHFHLGAALKELLEDEAEAHFEKAADALELLGDYRNLANCEEHLGDISIKKKQWIRAQRSYEAAVSYYRRSHQPQDAVRALVKAGDVAAERRLYPKAQRFYDEALALAGEQLNNAWGAVILYKKGLAHIDAGELETGERELELARRTTVIDLSQIDGFMENLLRRLEEELNSMQEAER